MKKHLLLILTLLSLCVVGQAWGATVYVEKRSGTVYYDTTVSSCDDTIDESSGDLQDAVDAAAGGETCICTDLADSPDLDSDDQGVINITDDNSTITFLNGSSIDGSRAISSWTDDGNGVYKVSEADFCSGLFEGNVHLEKSTDGVQDGGDNQGTLTDSGESWTVDAFIGYTVYNLTDGSKGEITDNDGTTVDATLTGGTDDDWDDGDEALIMNNGFYYYNPVGTADDVVYYQPTSGTPGDHTVKVCMGTVFPAAGRSSITFNNPYIRYADYGVRFTTSGGGHRINSPEIHYIINDCIAVESQNSGDVDVSGGNLSYANNGIYHRTNGNGNEVNDTTISYMNYDDTWEGDGHAIGVQKCEVDVSNCHFYNCRKPISYWSNDSGDIATGTVDGCLIEDSLGAVGRSGNYEGTGIIISNAAANAVVGMVISNNVIDTTYNAIVAKQSCQSGANKILNNTIINSTRGVAAFTSADYYEFKNNIFSNNDIHHRWHDGVNQVGTNNVADYNIYYPDGATHFYYRSATPSDDFADWQTDSGEDANSLTADPRLTGDYKLNAESPCIDAGTDLSATFTRDIRGRFRPQGTGFDIGAYESRKQVTPIDMTTVIHSP